MKQIFDHVSASCSKLTTRRYSTSFSLGIRFLSKKFHDPIYGVYGFVRLADEIVDSFHDYDKVYLMKKFRADTVDALENKISLNPILNSFQQTVHSYGIEWELIDTFLISMETDLKSTVHDKESYDRYILGSAEVVGLMCLRIFTELDSNLYDALKPSAMKLGSAFQKINFLRDLKADYYDLGRTYFPEVDFEKFSSAEKEIIQADIEGEFNAALEGIKELPVSSRTGVYLAYIYYRKLFSKIKETPAEKVMSTRIRIPDINKVGLLFQSVIRLKLNLY
ncbi:MAG: phytoene/squalene synthase family protein [Chitinophagaceae bacterium]|jgi:phytoene/squalene synthetase|nr:phytoene/squalene synthase family protein [Chitinophagaceae bacterium]